MRSIIQIFLAALLLSGTTYSIAAAKTGPENYQQRTEDRHLSGFNAVDLAGSFDVYITQGATESVRVEAPEEVINHIITEVNGGVLKIYNKNDHFHWGDIFGSHKKIAIYVTAKDINAVNVTGSGDVYFRDGIRTNSLRLRVSGSGDMVGRVDVKTLESSISGSGDVKLSGHAENSSVSVIGSGDYSARGLVTMNTAVRVAGSGDADVNVSNKLEASVSGSGDVRYTGNPKSISTSKSGSGDIDRF